MPSEKRKFGNLGEKIACQFLLNKGYSILGTNYQKKVGEIDIVAKFRNTIHFVEVKTRTMFGSKKYGTPQEAVSFYKQKKLIKTALFYLSENSYSSETNWQIDVVAIIIDEDKKKARINHLESAVDYDSIS
jgi:putative endonuclease